jgi:hypothetical protein
MPSRFIDTLVTSEDPIPDGVPNPIHESAGADAAGYAGALVSGIRTYGWAANTITKALGKEWLESGWIDYSLRRPLFADEVLNIMVEQQDNHWSLSCIAGEEKKRVVLVGTAGLGNAVWLDELEPPKPGTMQPQPASLPSYDLDHVPLRQPLNPLTVHLSSEQSRLLVAKDLGLDTSHYVSEDINPAFVHPYFLSGRMSPLTRHNFVYGPTIHVRSQIQHKCESRADQEITVSAQIVDAYDRKGHWYQVLDGIVTDSEGEVALIRHHNIFRPRPAN